MSLRLRILKRAIARVNIINNPKPFLVPINPIKSNLRLFSTENTLNKEKNPSTEESAKPKKSTVEINQSSTGEKTSHSFKAETQKILDIVSTAIYTNKEIFLRELISNASDASESLRYLVQKDPNGYNFSGEFKIDIQTDPDKNILVISDKGVGMTRAELTKNLGIIARSGSKEFLEKISKEGADKNTIIGQFGVGFYSAFMVSKKVEIFTKSSKKNSESLYWVSDGSGEYSISEASNVEQGTKIIIHLKDECSQFSQKYNIQRIIKQYSNFVKFPILLNGEKVNLQGALWSEIPSSVSKIKHSEFYKYLTNAYDEPIITLHFHIEPTGTNIPFSALIYVPKTHSEKFGNSRMQPGIHLYCRKVLIQKNSTKIIPDWLRFLKGVVDCESLSLNISRENSQDSEAITKTRRILVKRFIAHLVGINKRSPEEFLRFYDEYSLFLKEGICTDNDSKYMIADLLRFETSSSDKPTSFAEYLTSFKKDQKPIYYLVTTNRNSALNSPYYEAFKRNGTEVIFLYTPIDEFVMQSLGEYNKRPIISIESDKVNESDISQFDDVKSEFELSKSQVETLLDWLNNTLKDKVRKITTTASILKTPAIITGHENSSIQAMMRMANQNSASLPTKYNLKVNPSHPIMRGLFYTMTEDAKLAKSIALQVYDNAIVEAGLKSDYRGMLGRINEIMARAMDVDVIEMEIKEKMKENKIESDKKGNEKIETVSGKKMEKPMA